MYKSLQVKIIKNDKLLDDSDYDSDYEYLFDDEFKSYECVDNYLIVDID